MIRSIKYFFYNFYDLYILLSEFGLSFLFGYKIMPGLPWKSAQKAAYERQKYVKKWIYNNYRNLFNIGDLPNTKELFSKNIWVMWWQGKDAMPLIVRLTYESILKNVPSGFSVHLITKYNIDEYVQIPPYIKKLAEDGRISFIHLSDIIRMSLLAEYGGIWIDSTVYIPDLIPNQLFQQPFFTISQKENGCFVSKCKWTSFIIGGNKDYILFTICRDFLFSYWKQHKMLFDYLLIDDIIAVVYDNINQVKNDIDMYAYYIENVYELMDKINNPYNPDIVADILSRNIFNKLTYKFKPRQDIETIYQHMVTKGL